MKHIPIVLISLLASSATDGSFSLPRADVPSVCNRLDLNGRPASQLTVLPGRPPITDSDTTFVLMDTLDLPVGFSACPGQFSRNGLNYYLSLGRGLGTESLYVLSRVRIEDTFGPPQLVAGRVNEPRGGLFHAVQPSITADGKTLVFVRSDGYWEGDDLYLATRADTAAPFDSVRPLAETNVGRAADAYPWISPDGLRLHYTRDTGLCVATRHSVQDTFGAPCPLLMHGSSVGLFSAWLTDSELELYCADGSTIRYASRTSPDDSFSVPVQHPEFSGLGFVSGPSMFTERLYLYNDDATGVGRILIFAPASGGMEEKRSVTARMQPAGSSLLRNVLFLPQSVLPNPHCRAALLDIAGRKVLALHPGANDVSRFAPGVYFVAEQPQAVRKIVIQR